MLQLLSSFWFIALAALLVPVLIHFWNKKQPQRIKVGSIKWLTDSVSKKARNLRFQDWPLLLLRCLLLTALVMFLVQPVWKQKLLDKHNKYAWIAPELLQMPQLSLIQNTLDSLQKQEYELRQLNKDFTLITPEDWDNIKQSKLTTTILTGPEDYWILANRLSHQFNAAAEHVIFTSNQLAHFTSRRPQLNLNIKWITVPVDKQKVWVQEAFFKGSDSIIVLLAQSTSTGTTVKQYSLANPTFNQTLNIASAPELTFSKVKNQAFISTPDNQDKVLIKADSLQIEVFYDQSRKVDASYLRAALAAIRTYTQRPFTIKLTNNIQNISSKSDYIFWLSDMAIPMKISALIEQGLFILKDAPLEVKSTSGNWLRVAGLPESIILSKQAPVTRENNYKKWQNNFGESVLNFIPAGKGGTYYFASRFNNQWNSLPESSFFPEILSDLLWPEPVIKPDARQIAESQLQPDFLAAPTNINTANFETLDLKYWFLLLAALLFLTERIWVFQKAKIIS